MRQHTAFVRSTGFKSIALLLGWVALAFSSISVGAVEPPSDKGDRVVTGGDLAFMNEAAPGGLAEVELGRLAEERAASAEVKAFARQMIADHAKAGEKLKQLAQQKKVVLPEAILPKAKQTKEMLSKLQGAEFDRAYVKAMLEVHLSDVAAFEAVAKNATDADVKAFAGETVPTLKHHLEMIRAIAQTMNIKAD